MSQAWKCDRCGGFFAGGDQGNIANNPYDVRVGNRVIDLCPSCRDELYMWYTHEEPAPREHSKYEEERCPF